MNSLNLAQNAYATTTTAVRSPGATEYDALARVTHRLRTAENNGDFPALAAAIHDNRRLWTLLAVDVADAGNGLPQDLRARLFYLAEFTLLHGSRVLAGKADAQPMIDINTAVMRGLKQQDQGA